MPAASTLPRTQLELPADPREDEQEKPFDRRRDWLSFLTWAFFLAELAGREGLLGTGAHAAESDSARPAGRPGEDGAAADNLPVNPIATDAEEPTNTLLPQGPTIVSSQPTKLLGEVGDAEVASAEDIESQRVSGGSGGGAGGDVDPGMNTQAVHADASQISLALGQPLEVGGIDLQLASGGLDGLDTLLPGVQLDVPLIADLLGTATDSIGSLANGALSSLGPILSIGGNGGYSDDSIASGGLLNFDRSSEPEAAASQQGYTDYGIALNLSFSEPEAGNSGMQSSGQENEPANFDHGDWHAPIGATSDALHADEAVLRIASDSLG